MIHEYQYVFEVYKEKSFSRAAKNLFISQPSLSATIKKIENQLGYQIFNRSTVKLSLTTEGQAYINAAEKILNIEHDLDAYITDLSQLQTGNLTIAGSALFSSCVIPYIVRVFSNLHPKIKLNFMEADSLLLYEAAQENQIDLIIDAGAHETGLFQSEKLFCENILLAIHQSNPLIHKYHLKDRAMTTQDILQEKHLLDTTPAIDLSLLKDESFILLKKGHDLHQRTLALCAEAGFTPISDIHLNQLMTAYHIAASGLGSTILTDTLIKHGYTAAPLYYFKIQTKCPELIQRDVFIAYQNNAHVTRAMKSFINAAKKIRIFD